MVTYTEILPERKSSKRSAIRWTPAGDNAFSPRAGVLEIDTDRASAAYVVCEFPADGGRGFHFSKLDAGTDAASESYDVFTGRGGSFCCCKGYARHGNCKHCDAAAALIANGWL